MTQPAMPTVVHLGPFTYRITEDPADWASLETAERDEYGHTSHTAATIYVQPDVQPALKRVIVLHEILHAAAFAGGQLDDRKRDEETWVLMATAPLLDALVRSPGLVEWLTA
jgi:hypothetical protein